MIYFIIDDKKHTFLTFISKIDIENVEKSNTNNVV